MSEKHTRRVGDRGQVTIPKEFRQAENIQGGDEVVVEREDGTLHIRKARPRATSRPPIDGRPIVIVTSRRRGPMPPAKPTSIWAMLPVPPSEGCSVQIRRGDVVLVDFDPTEGSEQRGTRPAVVVQNDAGNEAAPMTIVVPLTTTYTPDAIAPYESEIPAATTDVESESVALCNQIRTISVADHVVTSFGGVSPSSMRDIEQAIRVSLGL